MYSYPLDPIRAFEPFGIYISIIFSRNLDREPRWKFVIDNVEDCLHDSGAFGNRQQCVKEALKKAVEFL
jgi:hypothetical protein